MFIHCDYLLEARVKATYDTITRGITLHSIRISEIGSAKYKRNFNNKIISNEINECNNCEFYITLTNTLSTDKLHQIISQRKEDGITDKLKIYVSPLCVTPRDIIRNTYDITKSKEKADIIAIPNVDAHIHKQGFCHGDIAMIVKLWGERFVLCECFVDITDRYLLKNNMDECIQFIKSVETQIRQAIQAKINTAVISVSYMNTDRRDVLTYEENFLDILNGNEDKNKLYIMESYLPLNTPNILTPDSLLVLYHCNDKEIFEKLLLGSNWFEYPKTTALLLFNKMRELRWLKSGLGRAMKSLYDHCEQTLRQNKTYGKDLNMLQDFILKICGLQDRGFVNKKMWEKLQDMDMSQFIPARYVIQKKQYADDDLIEDDDIVDE